MLPSEIFRQIRLQDLALCRMNMLPDLFITGKFLRPDFPDQFRHQKDFMELVFKHARALPENEKNIIRALWE